MMRNSCFLSRFLFSFPFMFVLVFSALAQTKSLSSGIQLLAFGSCNKHDFPQPIWKPILEDKPDVFVWLGDIVYGDTPDMDLLRRKYQAQKEIPDYISLRQRSKILGIWDDHDYGINDGGKYFAQKRSSQQVLLDFLDEPVNSSRRKREGAYDSYYFGEGEQQVKVILLDARYHRDTLYRENRRYLANDTGSLLGEEQWLWLERELRENTAQVTVIASGIQMIPTEHAFEKWQNFPKERKKLLDLIADSKVKNPILISGDRHIAEISRLKDKKFPHGLFEITSSGMTHTWGEYREEYNPYRVGKLIASLHYGTLFFDWENKQVQVAIKGTEGQIFLEQGIPLR